MTSLENGKKGFRPELLKRIFIYGALVLLIGSAQCSFFSQLDICPATPDLMIGTVLAIALLDSQRSAAVVGLCGGFFTDALGNSGSLSFSALFYLLCAAILGYFSLKMLPRFLSFACLMLPALALRALYTALCLCVRAHGLPPLQIMTSTLIPEIITTALLCLPLYPIVRLCVIPMNARSRFSF